MKKNDIGKTEMMDKDGHFECGSKVASGKKVAGLMVYRKGKKWGFCDADGNVVIHAGYDLVLPFSGGVAVVELNGKWGLIDTGGSTVVPVTYDRAFPFNDDVVAVELNGKWGYIDIKGHADTWKDGLKSVAQA